MSTEPERLARAEVHIEHVRLALDRIDDRTGELAKKLDEVLQAIAAAKGGGKALQIGWPVVTAVVTWVSVHFGIPRVT